MAFKMKKDNLGKAASALTRRTIPGAGGKRNLLGGLGTWSVKGSRLGRGIDLSHAWEGVKDFFGNIASKIKKPELKGGKKLLPTTIAQRRKWDTFYNKHKGANPSLNKNK